MDWEHFAASISGWRPRSDAGWRLRLDESPKNPNLQAGRIPDGAAFRGYLGSTTSERTGDSGAPEDDRGGFRLAHRCFAVMVMLASERRSADAQDVTRIAAGPRRSLDAAQMPRSSSSGRRPDRDLGPACGSLDRSD